jgi:hypothetical protein
VLTPDVRFEGWNADDWQRLLSLFAPRAPVTTPDAADRERPRGGLFIVHDGSHVRKVLHTDKGRLSPGIAWPASLESIAHAHGVEWVVAGQIGALDDVMERFGARAQRSDDLTTQALSLVTILREVHLEGGMQRWPSRLSNIPLPNERMIERVLDSVCPSGKAIVLGLFQEGLLWTALVARRRGRGFDVIAGPDELRPAMGVLSGDFRRDYRHLADVVEDRYAPLALGCYGEVDTLRALQSETQPGAWSRAVALRDIVLSPMPAAAGLALGVDTVRFAYGAARAVVARVDPLGVALPLLSSAQQRIGSALADRGVGRALGLDFFATLRALTKREEP